MINMRNTRKTRKSGKVSTRSPTKKPMCKIMLLDRSNSSFLVLCRVWPRISSNIIPSLSVKRRWEFAYRSILRMENITTLRGNDVDNHMIGPADYYTNLECPHNVSYTIHITHGFPVFREHPPVSVDVRPNPEHNIPTSYYKTIRGDWISGTDHHRIRSKRLDYKNAGRPFVGESIFPRMGVFEIFTTTPMIRLPIINNGYKKFLIFNTIKVFFLNSIFINI